MNTVLALKISSGKVEYINIENPVSHEQIHKLLGSSEVSSYVRFLEGFFRLRCYCRDYIPNPSFYSAINSDETLDIPEDCIFILEDSEYNSDLEEYEFLSMNNIVQACIEKHLGYYVTKDGQQQPCIKW